MKRNLLKPAALLLSAALGILLLIKLRSVVYMLLFSAAVAYLLDRPIRLLNRKVGRVCTIILLLLGLAGLIGGLITVTPLITGQFSALFDALPDIVSALESRINTVNGSMNLKLIDFSSLGERFSGAMVELVLKTGRLIGNGLWLLPVPVISFYLLKDKEMFLSLFHYLIPMKHRDDFTKVMKKIDSRLRRYIKGQFLVAFFVSLFTLIGLWILRTPFALALALIMGICNMIPYIGPWFGALPILLTVFARGFSGILGAIILIGSVQLLDNYVISPKVIGQTVELHPVLILTALMAFSILLGPVGLLLAVPGMVILQELGLYLLDARRKRKEEPQ